jgi:hypothetical protein
MLTIPPISIANTMPDLVARVQQVIDVLNAGVADVNANTAVFALNANSAVFALTANNATNFNGQPASFYTNATNITTGTLAEAQLTANVALLSRTPQVWAGFNSFEAGLQVKSTLPAIIFYETDRGTDLKAWDVAVEGEVFAIRTLTDALGVTALPIQINRAGLLVTSGGFKTTGSPAFSAGVIGFFSNALSLVGGTNGITFVSADGTQTTFAVDNTALASHFNSVRVDKVADVERGYYSYTSAGTFATERAFIGATGTNANHGGLIRLTDGAVISAKIALGADYGNQLNLSLDSAKKPATATWLTTSDERTKRNISDWEGTGLDTLKATRFVSYEYNGLAETPDGLQGIGVLAQELESVCPQAVEYTEMKLAPTDVQPTEVLGVNFHYLFLAGLDAIKTLATRLEAVEAALRKQSILPLN